MVPLVVYTTDTKDKFRGISLVSVVYKMMCSLVQEKLVQVIESKQLLAEEQGGFRRGRGCRDQILTLTLFGTDESDDQEKGDVCCFY